MIVRRMRFDFIEIIFILFSLMLGLFAATPQNGALKDSRSTTGVQADASQKQNLVIDVQFKRSNGKVTSFKDFEISHNTIIGSITVPGATAPAVLRKLYLLDVRTDRIAAFTRSEQRKSVGDLLKKFAKQRLQYVEYERSIRVVFDTTGDECASVPFNDYETPRDVHDRCALERPLANLMTTMSTRSQLYYKLHVPKNSRPDVKEDMIVNLRDGDNRQLGRTLKHYPKVVKLVVIGDYEAESAKYEYLTVRFVTGFGETLEERPVPATLAHFTVAEYYQSDDFSSDTMSINSNFFADSKQGHPAFDFTSYAVFALDAADPEAQPREVDKWKSMHRMTLGMGEPLIIVAENTIVTCVLPDGHPYYCAMPFPSHFLVWETLERCVDLVNAPIVPPARREWTAPTTPLPADRRWWAYRVRLSNGEESLPHMVHKGDAFKPGEIVQLRFGMRRSGPIEREDPRPEAENQAAKPMTRKPSEKGRKPNRPAHQRTDSKTKAADSTPSNKSNLTVPEDGRSGSKTDGSSWLANSNFSDDDFWAHLLDEPLPVIQPLNIRKSADERLKSPADESLPEIAPLRIRKNSLVTVTSGPNATKDWNFDQDKAKENRNFVGGTAVQTDPTTVNSRKRRSSDATAQTVGQPGFAVQPAEIRSARTIKTAKAPAAGPPPPQQNEIRAQGYRRTHSRVKNNAQDTGAVPVDPKRLPSPAEISQFPNNPQKRPPSRQRERGPSGTLSSGHFRPPSRSGIQRPPSTGPFSSAPVDPSDALAKFAFTSGAFPNPNQPKTEANESTPREPRQERRRATGTRPPSSAQQPGAGPHPTANELVPKQRSKGQKVAKSRSPNAAERKARDQTGGNRNNKGPTSRSPYPKGASQPDNAENTKREPKRQRTNAKAPPRRPTNG